eukprot:SAG11_NODE_1792_length_4254_cov_20.360770_1_plen_639_part_00
MLLDIRFRACISRSHRSKHRANRYLGSRPLSLFVFCASSSRKMAAAGVVVWGFLWALMCGCVGGAVDIAALAAFDIDPALKQFIGSMYEEFQADKAALRAELAEERRQNMERKEENQLLTGQVVGLQAMLYEFGQLTNKTRVDMERVTIQVNMTDKRTKVDAQKMTARLDQCETNSTQKRRTQDAEQVVGNAEIVHIFKRSVSTTHLSGRVDESESNGGHRLLGEGADCSSAEITQQIDAINVECCDEPGEDCSAGHVRTCNAGCGALIMPLWTACRPQLGSAAKVLQDAVALCPPPNVSPTRMDANMFMVTCPPGEAADDCIPMCEEAVHGYLLLLNINGEDAKLTCELHHDGYSWVGGASDGGYIGAVFEAFFSSVISGAAGTYIVTIMANQTVHTDVTIQPGQVVAINGDRALPQQPTWGSGLLTVAETGSLSLSYMQIASNIIIAAGAMHLTLDTCLLTFTNAIVLQPGLSLTMKSTTMTSTETMLLRDGMHATFIGMNATFGGNPSWVVTKSGETATGQVCDADGTNCVEDLCQVVDCNGGDTGGLNPGGTGCVSPQGTCDCGDPQGHGFSGDRCETHTCCTLAFCRVGYGCQPGCGCGAGGAVRAVCGGCCFHASWCDANDHGWDAQCDRTC